MIWVHKAFILAILSLILSGCLSPQPHNINNICAVFAEYPEWYWAAKKTEQRWGVPVPVQMAIMYQESSFRSDAAPINIKTKKPTSSAYGYAQALVQTWQGYKESSARYLISLRSDFASASDFMGWYANQAQRTLHISPNDAYDLYLAYHEGMGGYHSHSYLKKPWLIKVARSVQSNSNKFQQQLQSCVNNIKPISL